MKDIEDPHSEIVIYRFCTILFGFVSSPFAIDATLRHHLRTIAEENPVFVNKMINSLYCDDLTTTVDTLEEAVELHIQAKERMAKGSLNLRKWNSNSSKFMEMIQERSDEKPGDIEE